MDVAYVVRPGEANQELRYSLRTLVNVPHDRVFIGGYVPKWTRNVVGVPRRQTNMRFVNSSLNLYAVCQSDISEEFIFFNDDFFVMRPYDLRPFNRGPLDVVMAKHKAKFGENSYYKGMVTTRDWLAEHYEITEPLSYGLHIPMVVQRDLMWRLLEETRIDKPQGRPQYHMRTIYGNVAEVGGDVVSDVKLAGSRQKNLASYQFLSTSEKSFAGGHSGKLIRTSFPTPSPYEAASVRPTPRKRVDRRVVKRPVINR